MQPARSTEAECAAEWYRERHCWPVRVVGNTVVLPLGGGIVAFEVPASRAAVVYKALEHNDIRTPALLAKDPEPSVIFLAEADDAVLGQFQMPSDVRYLTVPQSVELPLVSMSPAGDRKWLCPPRSSRRWLPSASAVLVAVNDATPISLRARRPPRRPAGNRILIG